MSDRDALDPLGWVLLASLLTVPGAALYGWLEDRWPRVASALLDVARPLVAVAGFLFVMWFLTGGGPPYR